MSFEVNSRVAPVVDLTLSGLALHTAGISGTVLDRQQGSGSPEQGITLYNYQVRLDQAPILGSGTELSPSRVYWFSDSDLGNSTATSILLVDPVAVAASLSTGQSNTQTSISRILQLLSDVDTGSKYYDSIQKIKAVVQANVDLLGGTSTGNAAISDLRNIEQVATSLGLDSIVLQEISENLFGFYDVVTSKQKELDIEHAQAKLQQELAYEDDGLNFKAFTEAYINSEQATLSLVPDPTGSIVPIPYPEQDPEPDQLITPSLILEQDE